MTTEQPTTEKPLRQLTAQEFIDIITEVDKEKYAEFYYLDDYAGESISINEVEVTQEFVLLDNVKVNLPLSIWNSTFSKGLTFRRGILTQFKIQSCTFNYFGIEDCTFNLGSFEVIGSTFSGNFLVDSVTFHYGFKVRNAVFNRNFQVKGGTIKGGFEIYNGTFKQHFKIEDGHLLTVLGSGRVHSMVILRP